MTNTITQPPLRILIAGWEGGGNVPPVLEAIRALVERGHDVRLISDNSMAAGATLAGARHIPWLRAPNRPDRTSGTCFVRDWTIAAPMDQLRAWATKIFVGPAVAYARDMVDVLSEETADLIISSDLLFGAMLGAEKACIPAVTLAANISIDPLPGHPPFSPGFLPAANEAERDRDHQVTAMTESMWNSFLPDLNTARTIMGLEPLARTLDQLHYAIRHLLATSTAFDFPVTHLPEKFRYVGPLLEEPDWAAPLDLPYVGDKPLVLVAFSTTFQGQDRVLTTIVEAARHLPLHAIVTLGNAMEDRHLPSCPNVTIIQGASHDAILKHAAATITHGGHGTTMRSLRHGVPLLVLPMGRDQSDNAARVEYHGAGLRLPATASAPDIAQALHRLIAEPGFAANARKVARALATDGSSSSHLVAEIEAAASTVKAAAQQSCAA